MILCLYIHSFIIIHESIYSVLPWFILSFIHPLLPPFFPSFLLSFSFLFLFINELNAPFIHPSINPLLPALHCSFHFHSFSFIYPFRHRPLFPSFLSSSMPPFLHPSVQLLDLYTTCIHRCLHGDSSSMQTRPSPSLCSTPSIIMLIISMTQEGNENVLSVPVLLNAATLMHQDVMKPEANWYKEVIPGKVTRALKLSSLINALSGTSAVGT